MAESLSSTQTAGQAWAITPDTNNDLAVTPRALYVGGVGDVAVRIVNPTTNAPGTVTFVGVAAGTILPIRPIRVLATSTASNFVGLS